MIKVYRDYVVLQLKVNATLEDSFGNLSIIPLENSGMVALLKLYTNGKYYFDNDEDLPKIDPINIVDENSYETHIDKNIV